jgi:pimeloyl-ACP methyl ester carboxylesterase
MTGTAAAQSAGAPRATNASFNTLKQVEAGELTVGYADVGSGDGPVVILLHGWPYDIHSFVDVAPLLAAAGHRVIVPYLRGYGTTRFRSASTPRNGQQSVVAVDLIALMGCAGHQTGGHRRLCFATERGRAGYDKYRRDFSKLIWRLASPKWEFDDATFDRTAAAFDNPDHVAIVIHNYRWRLGLAAGEPKYDELEQRLAEAPVISVPTITLEGDANGAPHPEPAAYASKFAGKYTHRTITGGIGHNLPQEAPQAFAQAVIDAARL